MSSLSAILTRTRRLAKCLRRPKGPGSQSDAFGPSPFSTRTLCYPDSRPQQDVQRYAVFRSLAGVNPRLKDRGVKTAPFVVLIGTDMPAILAEVSCLSNVEEVELLERPLYRDHIAEALFKGVVGYARLVNSPSDDRVGP